MSRLDLNANGATTAIEPLVLKNGGPGTVHVPDAINPYTAQFSKIADNLILQGDNGKSVVLIDYFKHATLPDLKAADDGVLRGSVVEKLAGALDMRVAQAGGSAEGVPIGQVETVEGSARVQRADGSVEQLSLGVKIFQNDVLITDADGRLSVTFADGTIFSLSAASRMVVDELIYDPDSDENSGAFSLVQGGFVFVAGQVAKTGGMTVDTPAATMGIRGTNVSTQVFSVGGETEVSLALNPDFPVNPGDPVEIGSIDVSIDGVYQATLIVTDELWVISSATGEIVTLPRSIEDDEQDLIDEAFEAFQLAQTRFQETQIFLDNDSQGTPGRNISPSDNDFNEPPNETPPDETPGEQEQNDAEEGGEFDDTQLQDGGNNNIDNLRNPGDAPVANDVVVAGLEDSGTENPVAGVLPVTAGPGETLTFQIVSGPENGQADVDESGAFTYVPDANFAGTDNFTYSVSNGIDEVASATVTVNIAPVNDPPEPEIDVARTTEDEPVVIDPVANDFDIDGDTLEIVLAGGASNGQVEINADNTLTYTPNPNFFGNDSFEYTVSDAAGAQASATVFVTVAFENDGPESTPDTVAANEDEPVTFDPLGNDVDADGDPLTFVSVESPSNGSVVINADNTLTYTPNQNFNGTDSFDYIVTDGQGGTDTGTITVNVGGVNDAPTVAPDSASVAEDTPVTLNPLLNDSDPDGDTLTITAVSDPANGAVVINPDGTLTYTPDLNFSGVDTFTYTVEDGQGGSSTATVTVGVDFINDLPVAENDVAITDEDQPIIFDPRSNDSDGDGDTLLITSTSAPANGNVEINIDGSLTYTPAADFNGSDSFTYTIEDGRGGSATATVDVTVSPVNDPPVPVNDPISTAEDTPVTFDPRGNDSDPDGDPLTITGVSDPPNGSVDINPDGTLTYTPDANFSGSDSFTYTVDDGQGGSSTATVLVSVDFVNDPPVANDDSAATAEDQSVTFDPRVNDTDVDEDTLLIVQTSAPTNGSVLINIDGSLTYTPNADFNGSDSFTYTIEDGRGGSSTATVDIVVTAVNDAPVTTVDAASTDEDIPVTFDPRDNDTDPDGDPLTVISTSDPPNGSVLINGDGTLTYTPDPNYNGTDSFTYTVSDGQGGTATETVTVFIGLVNDPPVAADDAVQTDEDVAVTFDPRDNDIDLDGDSFSITETSTPTNGTVAINGNGTLTYTPDADFSGTDSFTYTIDDGQGASDTATVTVSIASVNDLPVAADDAATTDEDVSITFAPLSNDSDADGDPLTITGTSVPANGSVSINANGTLTYTPDENYNGSDSFTYTVNDGQGGTNTATVTVTINAVNDAPVAADDSESVDEDVSVDIAVLDNDSDVDGDTLTISDPGDPSNGTVVINVAGGLTYTPDANFNGSDSFTYTISDGNGGTDTATVSITVNPVNDAPVAADDTASTNEDVSVTFDPRANDTDIDGDPLTITGTSVPANGAVTINGDGTLTYTPDADFAGSDSFTYTIGDGQGGTDTATVSVTVNAVNDAPVAADDAANVDEDDFVNIDVLGNDSDVEGDALSIISASDPSNGSVIINANNTVTYTPNANFNGSDSFNYTISDGNGGTDTATVTVTVAPINDAPVALDDSGTTAEDASITVSVLDNDSDVDGNALTVIGTSAASNGSVIINANNTVTYTPNANFNGSDSFTYTISDGQGGTDTATVNITITPGNDAPVAVDDSASVDEDSSVSIAALSNDGDLDGDTLTITGTTDPANGSVSIVNGTGLTYTPDADFNGADSFTYTISDGNGGTDTATVSITVNPINDVPVAEDDTDTTVEDTSVTIDVLSNDGDIDGDTLTISAKTDGTNGVVVINANNTVTYTPDADFNGTDSFTYTIADGNGGSATATVNITVTADNDTPVALNDSATVDEDDSVDIAVLTNDSDADGDNLSITTTSAAANGTVDINADNTLTYTPDANFNGNDSFSYTVSDGNGGTDEATVNITVTAVNDVPEAEDDSDSVDENQSVTIAVLSNDTDVDNDTLTVTSVTPASDGDVVINANNTITYTPDGNFNGSDSFTYTISDGNGGTDTATVSITVNNVNDPPEAAPDLLFTVEGSSGSVNVVSNDFDIDNDTLIVISTTNPSNGTSSFSGGSVTYNASGGFFGIDSFDYTVSDGNGGTDTATVTVVVEQDPSDLPSDFPVTVTFNQGSSPSNPGSYDIDITAVDTTNINLVFAMDSSGSITQNGWNTQKAAVQNALGNLADDFAGSQTSVDVYIISYSSNVQTIGKFDLVTQETSLINGVGGLPFQAAATNWEAALDTANSFFSGEPNDEVNILYFLTDGNPVPTNQDWQGALNDLNNSVNVDIEAFAIGPNVTLDNLNTVDSDGSATQVTNAGALEAAFGETPLFNTQMVAFSLELNVDGVDQGQIADISDINTAGLSFDIDIADFTNAGDLGNVNVFSLTASFDLDGDLSTTSDVYEVFSVGTLTQSNSAGLTLVSNSSGSSGGLVPLSMTLGVEEGNGGGGGGTQLTGVLNLDPNSGNLPGVGGGGSSGPSGPTGFGEDMNGVLGSMGMDSGEGQSLPTA